MKGDVTGLGFLHIMTTDKDWLQTNKIGIVRLAPFYFSPVSIKDISYTLIYKCTVASRIYTDISFLL